MAWVAVPPLPSLAVTVAVAAPAVVPGVIWMSQASLPLVSSVSQPATEAVVPVAAPEPGKVTATVKVSATPPATLK